jgi:hypothetical protein
LILLPLLLRPLQYSCICCKTKANRVNASNIETTCSCNLHTKVRFHHFSILTCWKGYLGVAKTQWVKEYTKTLLLGGRDHSEPSLKVVFPAHQGENPICLAPGIEDFCQCHIIQACGQLQKTVHILKSKAKAMYLGPKKAPNSLT